MYWIKVLILCCLSQCLFSSGDIHKKMNNTDSSIYKKLQYQIGQLGNISASFTQTIKKSNNTTSKTTGNLCIKKPDFFRWEVLSPEYDLTCYQNKKTWHYNARLKQVIIRDNPHINNILFNLFLNKKNISKILKQYHLSESNTQSNQWHIQLKAKQKNTPFKNLAITFKSNQLYRIYSQTADDEITITLDTIDILSDTSKLPGIHYPKEVDILDYTKQK
ncbi:MAG: outer membrane lipoprotein carrier protein LolA [Endozoicomonadaceae bacterium]|nr:outer membrane lipoprotein carrier protein LolA [Endozoicomonadaceae bacterium]